MKSLSLPIRLVVVLLVAILSAHSAMAAKIIKASASKAIIELDGLELRTGDQVFAVVDGKKRGLLEVTEVKGGKALAVLKKGQMKQGADIVLRVAGTNSSAKKSAKPHDATQFVIGGLVGYSYDSQSVTLTTETVTLTGSGYSLKGYADLPIVDRFGVLGRAGIEQFSVSGTSSRSACSGKSTCTTDITYLTGDLLLRYNFSEGEFVPFAAAGMGVHFPIAKSSNNLVESNISATTVFFLTGGLNWELSPGRFLPITLDYGYFPKTNEVTTYMINLRIGYGMLF